MRESISAPSPIPPAADMEDETPAHPADTILWCGAGTTEGLPTKRSSSYRPGPPPADGCRQHNPPHRADTFAPGAQVRSGASASSQRTTEGQKEENVKKAAHAVGAAKQRVGTPMAYLREKWLDLLLKGFLLPLALGAIGWFASKYIDPAVIVSSAPAQAPAPAQTIPLVGLCTLARQGCTDSAQSAAKHGSLCSAEICAWLQGTCDFSAEALQGCQKAPAPAPALTISHEPAGGRFNERVAVLKPPPPAALKPAPTPATSVAHTAPAPSLASSMTPAPAGLIAPPSSHTDNAAMLALLIGSLAAAGVIVALIWWRYRLRVKAWRAASNVGAHGSAVSTMCMV